MKHQEIIESLPWYVNGTLEQAERAAVTQHLATGCDECAREVKSLTAIQKAVKTAGDEAPEPSPFLLNRALAEIEDYERTRDQEQGRQTAKASASSSLWDRLRESWWPKTPVFARMALATQLALVLVLGAVAVYQYENPQVKYTTSTGTADGAAKLSIIFNENATEGAIRQALEEIHGNIVEGPTAQGRYTIQLAISLEQRAELDKIMRTLQEKKDIVRSVEEKQ
jgi:vacuolar-type H+-ATPase subunit I/STV1